MRLDDPFIKYMVAADWLC